MAIRLTATLAAFVFLTAASAVSAADGTIDTSFATDGRLLTGDVAQTLSAQEAVLALSDGSLLYYGFDSFQVRRYTTSGIVDLGFGSNGATSAPDIGQKPHSNGVVALDAAGRIYAAAGFSEDTVPNGVAVCRFDDHGALATFPAIASPCTLTSFATQHTPRAMRIAADGAIFVLGADGDLVRFRADGSVDTNFAPEGRFVLPNLAGDSSTRPETLVLGADGAIYVVGNEKGLLGASAYVTKLRIDAGTGLGFVDPIFNGGAPLAPDCGALLLASCDASAAVIRNGRLVVAGTDGTSPVIMQLDLVTGQEAAAPTALPLPADANAVAVSDAKLQHDGDLLLAGSSVHALSPFNLRAWLARVHLDCAAPSLDAVKFGIPDGSITFSMLPKPEAPSVGHALAIGLGRVFVAGHDASEGLASVTAIANADAFLDGIFADGFEGCD